MRHLIQLFCVAALLGGCATANVRYVESDDKTTEGFRYYLPRPFVAIKKPFPVEYHEEYLPGTVVGDRIRVDLAKASPKLRPLNPTGADIWYIKFPEIKVVDSVRVNGVRADMPAETATGKGAGDDGGDGGDGKEDPDTNKATPAATPTAASPSTVPLNEYFDVLYLPDFEQQYAINFESGLGVAKQTIKMQHGWMLTDYSGDTDNSKVLDSIGNFVGSMVSSAAGFAGIGARPADEAPQEPKEEPEDDLSIASFIPELVNPETSTITVLVKVMIAWNALPGTYPVLKPCEIERYKNLPAGSIQRLVPDPKTIVGAPFSILYTTQLAARFELVSIDTIQESKVSPPE